MAVAVDPASLETLDSDALIEVRELLAQVMELLEALSPDPPKDIWRSSLGR
jgi:hypothetical protein